MPSLYDSNPAGPLINILKYFAYNFSEICGVKNANFLFNYLLGIEAILKKCFNTSVTGLDGLVWRKDWGAGGGESRDPVHLRAYARVDTTL